jgi:hypothetical protein
MASLPFGAGTTSHHRQGSTGEDNLDLADEVAIIDLSPSELLRRLDEGGLGPSARGAQDPRTVFSERKLAARCVSSRFVLQKGVRFGKSSSRSTALRALFALYTTSSRWPAQGINARLSF